MGKSDPLCLLPVQEGAEACCHGRSVTLPGGEPETVEEGVHDHQADLPPVVHVSRRAACPLITAPNATTDHVPGVARSVGHRGELGLCHGLGLNGISVVVLVVDVVDMVTSLATQRSEPQPAGPPSRVPEDTTRGRPSYDVTAHGDSTTPTDPSE